METGFGFRWGGVQTGVTQCRGDKPLLTQSELNDGGELSRYRLLAPHYHKDVHSLKLFPYLYVNGAPDQKELQICNSQSRHFNFALTGHY